MTIKGSVCCLWINQIDVACTVHHADTDFAFDPVHHLLRDCCNSWQALQEKHSYSNWQFLHNKQSHRGSCKGGCNVHRPR